MHLQHYYNLLLWVVAAILNAAMDTTTHHYSTSIFKILDERFYNPNISWKYGYKFGEYKFDFWHMCKSVMIILFAIFAINYKTFTNSFILDLTILGVLWNLTFNLFYNKILRTK